MIKRNIKILFCPAHYIFDEYYGGSEPYSAFNIADRISQRHTSSIVVTGAKKVLKPKKYKIVELQPKKEDIDMSTLPAISFNFKYTREAIKLLRRERFDLIHHIRPFSIGSTFNIIPILQLSKGTPFIIGSFAAPYKRFYPVDSNKKRPFKNAVSFVVYKMLKPIIHRLSVLTLKRADKVIVYDDFTKDLVKKFAVEKKIAVIPPGKDGDIFKPASENKFDAAEKEIIAVGHMVPRKGFDLIIKAIAEVVKQQPQIKLRILGRGVEREKLQKLVRDSGLEDHVIFQGVVENRFIHEYYQRAHIFVHMAREESYGQVFVEALACGLPIISSNTLAAQQIISNRQYGIVVPQEGWKELAEVLNLLLKDKERMKKMSKNGRDFFEKTYDWDAVIIPKYLEVYNSVLS